MGLQIKLLGALVVTYFVSRLMLRLPNPMRRAWGITLAHLGSLVAILAILWVARSGAGAFGTDQLLVYIAPQVLWWLFDLLREHGLNRRFIGGSR